MYNQGIALRAMDGHSAAAVREGSRRLPLLPTIHCIRVYDMISELKYSNTNTYLVTGSKGSLLFDTGWAGTFLLLCKALGEKGLKLQDVKYLLISHFHPDHMGIASQIAEAGAVIAAADVQAGHLHDADRVLLKEKNKSFVPIDDSAVRTVPVAESREFLGELGISGEIIHTPGHTDDSISLWLDEEKALLVGDLNPLYELELHKGTIIYDTWERLLALKPQRVYYGHAAPVTVSRGLLGWPKPAGSDIYALVKRITRLTDRGFTVPEIAGKTGSGEAFVADVIRMYVTHPGVSVQGILDRIELRNK